MPHVERGREPHSAWVACLTPCVCLRVPLGEGGRLEVLKPHSKAVTAIEFNHDGSLLATGSTDGTVFLLHSESAPSELGPVPHFTYVSMGCRHYSVTQCCLFAQPSSIAGCCAVSNG